VSTMNDVARWPDPVRDERVATLADSPADNLRQRSAGQPAVKLDALKVAVVHEWFVSYAGSEKVVEQMLKLFPQADLYAMVDFLGEDQRGFLGNRKVTTSFIQRLPGARKRFRHYLPLMPLAVEQFDLSAYDLVISSNHAVAKGVITGPRQVHVSYVHTPIRYAWDLQHQYLAEAGLTRGMKSRVARLLLHYMRLWDTRTAHGVDRFLANSAYIARRIRKTYGRPATVVYPPVDIARFEPREEKEDFYLAASRMVPYKRMPMIVEAFAAMPERQLVVIGDGPDAARVEKLVRGAANIRFLGYQPDSTLADYMARARALVFAAEEDFGITPVEAQACGTPVIAYAAGGALETVVDSDDPQQRSGLFFREQSPAAIRAAVDAFESAGVFSAQACRANVERFSTECFLERLRASIVEALTDEMEAGA
jgi:glycosyltransferase involved in cell wall biosynthesis